MSHFKKESHVSIGPLTNESVVREQRGSAMNAVALLAVFAAFAAAEDGVLDVNCTNSRVSEFKATPPIPRTSFTCWGRYDGYYADVEVDCTIFHYCQTWQYPTGLNETVKWDFACPESTIFNQRLLACTAPSKSFECHESQNYFWVNYNIGVVPSTEASPVHHVSYDPEQPHGVRPVEDTYYRPQSSSYPPHHEVRPTPETYYKPHVSSHPPHHVVRPTPEPYHRPQVSSHSPHYEVRPTQEPYQRPQVSSHPPHPVQFGSSPGPYQQSTHRPYDSDPSFVSAPTQRPYEIVSPVNAKVPVAPSSPQPSEVRPASPYDHELPNYSAPFQAFGNRPHRPSPSESPVTIHVYPSSPPSGPAEQYSTSAPYQVHLGESQETTGTPAPFQVHLGESQETTGTPAPFQVHLGESQETTGTPAPFQVHLGESQETTGTSAPFQVDLGEPQVSTSAPPSVLVDDTASFEVENEPSEEVASPVKYPTESDNVFVVQPTLPFVINLTGIAIDDLSSEEFGDSSEENPFALPKLKPDQPSTPEPEDTFQVPDESDPFIEPLVIDPLPPTNYSYYRNITATASPPSDDSKKVDELEEDLTGVVFDLIVPEDEIEPESEDDTFIIGDKLRSGLAETPDKADRK